MRSKNLIVGVLLVIGLALFAFPTEKAFSGIAGGPGGCGKFSAACSNACMDFERFLEFELGCILGIFSEDHYNGFCVSSIKKIVSNLLQ